MFHKETKNKITGKFKINLVSGFWSLFLSDLGLMLNADTKMFQEEERGSGRSESLRFQDMAASGEAPFLEKMSQTSAHFSLKDLSLQVVSGPHKKAIKVTFIAFEVKLC